MKGEMVRRAGAVPEMMRALYQTVMCVKMELSMKLKLLIYQLN